MRTAIAIILAGIGLAALGALYLWMGLDATLEGEPQDYANEPIEHCSL